MNEANAPAKKMLAEANDRLFAINRETISPEIFIETPTIVGGREIEVGLRHARACWSPARISDKSLLAEFSINNIPVMYEGRSGTIPFSAEVEIPSDEIVRIVARDVYDNESVLTYHIRRTEVDPPEIQILAPYLIGDDVLIIDSIATTN